MISKTEVEEPGRGRVSFAHGDVPEFGIIRKTEEGH